LASFLRQAQLQRKTKKALAGKKYWWNVQWDANRRMEVVAGSAEVAKQVAAEEWGVDEEQLANAKVTALRPYEPESKSRYQIYNKQNGNAMEDAPDRVTNDEQALEHLQDYIEHGPHGLQPGQAANMFGIRNASGLEIVGLDIPISPVRARAGEPQPAGSVGQSTSHLAPHGPGPWEIYRLSDGTSVAELGSQHWRDAHAEAEQILSQRREAPELYGVRTFPFGRTSSTPVTGSTQDLQRQRATPGTFTGSWKVMANGEEVYRFSGVGNAQSDANRVAVQWLRNNGYSNSDDVEVLPIMS
jgi:hypothetical protein